MNRGAVTRLRGCVQENLGGIHRIKSVLLTTEVTTHFNFLALRQDRFGLLGPQASNHATDALLAAGAGKARAGGALQGLEAQQFFFPEKTAQDGFGIQLQQLLRL